MDRWPGQVGLVKYWDGRPAETTAHCSIMTMTKDARCRLLKQFSVGGTTTCLEALRHGVAPELVELCDFVEDGVDDDEAEVAVVDLSLEALQETHPIRSFHCRIILVIHDLKKYYY